MDTLDLDVAREVNETCDHEEVINEATNNPTSSRLMAVARDVNGATVQLNAAGAALLLAHEYILTHLDRAGLNDIDPSMQVIENAREQIEEIAKVLDECAMEKLIRPASEAGRVHIQESTDEMWPEFMEWQRLAIEVGDHYRMTKDCSLAEAELREEENAAFVYSRYDQMDELEAALFKRPVRSHRDAIALGIVAMFWNPGHHILDGTVDGIDDKHRDARSVAHLIRAVCMLAKPGEFPALAEANFEP